MSRQRRKGQIATQDFSPVEGVNYGLSPIDLSAKELARSMNLFYPRQTRRLTTRPPMAACTSDANSLSTPFLKGTSYYNGTTQYLVAASGGKIYYMTKATLDVTPAWTEIGSLTDDIVKPSMLVFNGLLLIADGGTDIRYWDGSTYGTLSNGPAGCTALLEARNAVWANSSEADSVYISTAEFTGTDFDQGSGSIVIKAGFGDGLSVNALSIAPGGNAVVVSKANNEQGEYQLRLVDVTDTTRANWRVSDPFVNKEAAQNAHGILNTSNSVFFFDETGMKRVEPTDQYGDLQSNPIFGDRINKTFESFSATVSEITYLPTLTAFMLLIEDHPQQYLYFPRNNGWCPWRLADLIINSVVTLDETIYLFSEDGILYKLDETKTQATDELTQGGTEKNIASYGRTKRVINRGYDIKLRRSTMYITPLLGGNITLKAILSDGTTERDIGTFAIEDGIALLGLADGLLGEATELLGDDGAQPLAKSLWGGPRSNGIQIEWAGDGVGYELDYISTEFEGPLGG